MIDQEDALRNGIRDVLEDKPVDPDRLEILSWDITNDTEPIYSSMKNTVAGYEGTQTATIEMYDPDDPGTMITVKTEDPITFVYDDKEDEAESETQPSLDLTAGDDWDDHSCPAPDCDMDWDQDAWDIKTSAGDAYGGVGVHECPRPDCNGLVYVYY